MRRSQVVGAPRVERIVQDMRADQVLAVTTVVVMVVLVLLLLKC